MTGSPETEDLVTKRKGVRQQRRGFDGGKDREINRVARRDRRRLRGPKLGRFGRFENH